MVAFSDRNGNRPNDDENLDPRFNRFGFNLSRENLPQRSERQSFEYGWEKGDIEKDLRPTLPKVVPMQAYSWEQGNVDLKRDYGSIQHVPKSKPAEEWQIREELERSMLVSEAFPTALAKVRTAESVFDNRDAREMLRSAVTRRGLFTLEQVLLQQVAPERIDDPRIGRLWQRAHEAGNKLLAAQDALARKTKDYDLRQRLVNDEVIDLLEDGTLQKLVRGDRALRGCSRQYLRAYHALEAIGKATRVRG